ncbi:MAG: sigma-70 family RNA polymerase sigma factor, partial [Planctomycetota bacterium]
MNGIPETRASLIIRLPGGADLEAWREFTEIYEPFVYRFARRRGLQDADAREVVQEVFLGISRAVRDFEPDHERARFRTWLFRIAKNQLLTLLRKRRESMLDSVGWNEVGATFEEEPPFDAEEEDAYRQE